MKIYTRGGDTGETGLIGGSRLPKNHQRIESYGTLDELNAVLGLVLSETNAEGPRVSAQLRRIQGELFCLGAELAKPHFSQPVQAGGIEQPSEATPVSRAVQPACLDEAHILELEQAIDAMEAEMPALTSFILPGGCRAAALLHLARTVSRRAERQLVALHSQEPLRPQVLQYTNRLSDYFFVIARWLNYRNGVAELPWP